MTNKDYKRMTDVDDRGKPCFTTTFNEETDECLIRHLQRLYELENAIENGTLVFLPFKCGDKMWHVWKTSAGTCHMEEMKLWEITITDKEIFYDTLHHGVFESTDDFYHTKEEAEKALEELKND